MSDIQPKNFLKMASSETTDTSPTTLPSSPAARAFFLALDSGEGRGADDPKGPRSPFIQKRLQTLGWRNRHSQSPFYPLTIHHPRRPFSAKRGSEASQSKASPSMDSCSSRDDDSATSRRDTTTSTTLEVLQVQRGEVEGTYGTGATVWPAAVVLCKYLEKHAVDIVLNKRIVDLGVGTAITSLACAVLGARSVICTDGPATVVQLARDNVRRVAALQTPDGMEESPPLPGDGASASLVEAANRNEGSSLFCTVAGCPITVLEYWWGSGSLASYPPCDVVLVSDCVLPKLYPIAPLVDALDELLPASSPSALAILSYEHRHYPEYDPRDKFRELAASKHLQVEVIPLEEQHEIYSVDDIEIWKVTRCK